MPFAEWSEAFRGRVCLYDGHMRRTEIRQEMSVVVTDLDEAEAEKALATFDPVGAMAGKNEAVLEELLSTVRGQDRGTIDLLDSLIADRKRQKDDDRTERNKGKGRAEYDEGSKTRKVEVVLDDESYGFFLRDAEEAGRVLGTSTISDTIIAAVRKAIGS